MKFKNRFFELTTLLISITILAGCTSLYEQENVSKQPKKITSLLRDYEDTNQGRIFVVAHRGCWTHAPENSIQAVKNCINLGVEAIEIDVQLTADRELIVFHDKTIDRMTGKSGLVSEMTLAELKSLKLYERDGSKAQLFDKPLLTHYSIATLRELLTAARGNIMINLEIKNSGFSWKETFAASTKLAREMNMADHIFWKIKPFTRGNSGDVPANEVMGQLDLNGLPYVMPILWQSSRGHKQQINDFKESGVTGFEIVAQDPNYWPIREDGRVVGADKYRFMGVAVLPRWSAGYSDDVALQDPDAAWGRLIDLGADLIMTDRPEQLIEYLEEKNLRVVN